MFARDRNHLLPDQLGRLPARTIELESRGVGRIVDPLFEIAMVEDLPGNPLGRSDPLSHLLRRHAALQLGERERPVLRALLGTISEIRNPKYERR